MKNKELSIDKNEYAVFKDFDSSKEVLKNELKCIICKLNEIYKKDIRVDNFSDDEILELYLEKRKIESKSSINIFNSLFEIKSIILSFSINLLAIIISLEIFKNNNQGFCEVITSIFKGFIIAIICGFIYYIILLKDIQIDKNNENNNKEIIWNIEFINKIIELKYKKKI